MYSMKEDTYSVLYLNIYQTYRPNKNKTSIGILYLCIITVLFNKGDGEGVLCY